MDIGGFQKYSLIDYPGKIASVIFTTGCNFRCFYCHNPELVLPELISKNQSIEMDDVLNYLDKNKSLLDAVVISGGEPTLHSDLFDFIREIKQKGLLVKLDTNGTNPRLINRLIKNNLVDYIAMDIKAKLLTEKYKEVVGNQFGLNNMDRVHESMELIQQSGIEYEFRTTLIKPNHCTDDIIEISKAIKGNYYLQEYNNQKTLISELNNSTFSKDELQLLTNIRTESVNILLRD